MMCFRHAFVANIHVTRKPTRWSLFLAFRTFLSAFYKRSPGLLSGLPISVVLSSSGHDEPFYQEVEDTRECVPVRMAHQSDRFSNL
jgi:hypothetical protein